MGVVRLGKIIGPDPPVPKYLVLLCLKRPRPGNPRPVEVGFIQAQKAGYEVGVVIEVRVVSCLAVPVAADQGAVLNQAAFDESSRPLRRFQIPLLAEDLIRLGHGGDHEPVPRGQDFIVL